MGWYFLQADKYQPNKKSWFHLCCSILFFFLLLLECLSSFLVIYLWCHTRTHQSSLVLLYSWRAPWSWKNGQLFSFPLFVISCVMKANLIGACSDLSLDSYQLWYDFCATQPASWLLDPRLTFANDIVILQRWLDNRYCPQTISNHMMGCFFGPAATNRRDIHHTHPWFPSLSPLSLSPTHLQLPDELFTPGRGFYSYLCNWQKGERELALTILLDNSRCCFLSSISWPSATSPEVFYTLTLQWCISRMNPRLNLANIANKKSRCKASFKKARVCKKAIFMSYPAIG
jgi:hypothetical protein